ncbi:MAG: hypothetical protein ACODAA_01530 [Gemmatimonadota bacterium]
MRRIRLAGSAGRSALLASLAILASGAGGAATDPSGDDPPDDPPEYVREASTPFRAPPDSVEVAGLLERWRSDGGLRTTEDRLLGARLWRRAGRAEAALALLDEIPGGAPTSATAALGVLERGRVRLELGEGARAARLGAADWRRACRALGSLSAEGTDALRDAVWTDIGLLATPEEREAWEALAAGEACAWLEDLLEERAFRMAITPDERLARHYRRLATARRYFYLDRPRFYVGMTHWHGRRDGEWMDDRGLIYVRMGPPDRAESCGAVLPFEADPFEGDLLSTCWIYDRPEGYKLYYFATRDKVTGRLSSDGDYYLQESLGPRANPSDPYFRRYVRHADIPRSLIRHLSFQESLNAGDDLDAGLDAVEDQAYRRQMQLATRRFADEALIEIPDVPRVTGMEMLWEPLRFLNPADGSWQVWIVASVPAGQLQALRGPGTWTYRADARLSTRLPDGVRIDSASNGATVGEPLPSEAGIPLRTFVVAESGRLPITLAVSDGARRGVGAWAQDTVTVPRALPVPMVSDIALARNTGGRWTRDGETFLRVSPDHVANPSGEIHAYFEVYGVRRTAEYEVELRLTPGEDADDADGAADVFAIDPSDLPFRLQFTDRMPYRRIGRHSLRLDLADTAPGEYLLAVRVRDVDTETRSLPSTTPVFVPDAAAVDGAGRRE